MNSPRQIRSGKVLMLLALTCLVLPAGASPVRINELMAANDLTLTDPQGQADDWIELQNTADVPVDLAGMYLTDSLTQATRWQIPLDGPEKTTLAPGGFIIIWADNNTDDEGLHAGFKLRAAGETVALFSADGHTLVDSIQFPPLPVDVSYGRQPDDPNHWCYMDVPTPGSSNQPGYIGVVANVQFSADHGFYDNAFVVELTTETEGATIRYTLDGSDPRSMERFNTVMTYEDPIAIDTTTCLRMCAVKPGWQTSTVNTQTYIFVDDVINQSQDEVLAAGFLPDWGRFYAIGGTAPADYGMDPEITGDPDYSDHMREAMMSLPAVSIVTDRNNLFSRLTGIYANPMQEGSKDDKLEWERPASAELIYPDGSKSFQINCGLRIQGGHSRRPEKSPKHAFSLRFRDIYGPGRLEYPLFGEDWPVQSFDTLHLRAGFNNVWTHYDRSQCGRAQYIRDQWMRDSLTDMGNRDALQGFYVHLYVDGLYWGLYILHERPDADHYAAYNGGDADRIDAINGDPTYVIGDPLNTGSVSDGTIDAWLILKDAVESRDWDLTCQLMDVDSFIDWTLLVYFSGTTDIKRGTNWRAAGGGPDLRPWRFYSWDAEHVMEYLDMYGVGTESDPSGLLEPLMDIEAFRIRFGDRIHKHLFNGGALTTERNVQRWLKSSDRIEWAIVAESARWGDYRRDVHPYQGPYELYTKNDHWIPERNELLNDYLPHRNEIALGMFRSMGLYPNVEAPVFYIEGLYQHGGQVDSGRSLSMDAPAGTIVYTLDGSDPRDVSSEEQDTTITLVPQDASKRILVPTGPVDDDWRRTVDYDDAGWDPVAGTVGFDIGWEYSDIIDADILDAMWAQSAGCLMRIIFDVGDPNQLRGLFLKARYDDGFAAYLNGEKIVQANAPETPAWNACATFAHEADTVRTFTVSSHVKFLRAGANLLAIHGLNASATSPDFLMSFELAATDAAQPERGRYTTPIVLDRSRQVKARTLSNGQWSALNEAVYAVGPIVQCLRITELMYHPVDPNAEFIELTNIGVEPIDLNLVQFTAGIRFTFPPMSLDPEASVAVCSNTAAFEAVYGANVPTAGQYTGSLDNGGERLTLRDAAGQVIQNFAYDDAWHPVTDGLGYSLTAVDPVGTDPNAWSEATAWSPSTEPGGTPGY